jgi:hypothetical protein
MTTTTKTVEALEVGNVIRGSKGSRWIVASFGGSTKTYACLQLRRIRRADFEAEGVAVELNRANYRMWDYDKTVTVAGHVDDYRPVFGGF